MEENKKATEAAPHTNRGKDSKNICISSAIKALFRTGKKLTAKKINQLTNSNDARKQISVLRRSGWNICDIRRPDGSKLYWLVEDDRQCLTLKDIAHECEYRCNDGCCLNLVRRFGITGAAA